MRSVRVSEDIVPVSDFWADMHQTPSVPLTLEDIENALPRIKVGLEKYCWLQAKLGQRDVARDDEYQTRFVGFYRVRRNATWRQVFFGLLEEAKRKPIAFEHVLRALHRSTGQLEASFASKLVATVDPSQPVMDAVVFGNLDLRLPARGAARRVEKVVELHARLAACFCKYLATDPGRYLVHRFTQEYPAVRLTEVKMLDLVLWQTRSGPTRRSS